MFAIKFSGNTISECHASLLAYAATLGAGASAKASPAVEPPSPGNPLPPNPTTEPTSPAGPTSSPETPSAGDGERDAAGVLWDPAKHAGTKAKVKSGLWRMKVGVTRPAGEGEEAITGTATGDAPPPPPGAATPPPPPPTPATDPNRPEPAYRYDNGDGTEQWHVGGAWDGGKHPIPADAPPPPAVDDEFAAFATANSGTAATTAGRTWTDADLSALCNQAAHKAGNPDPVREVIAQFVPANEIQHSRMVPGEKREEFAKALETKLGFTYAG